MNHILLLKCAATVVFFVAILTEFYILHTFSSNIQWVFQFNKYQYKQLNHTSKIKVLRSSLNSRETLQNFLYLCKKKTQVVDIDQGIHKGKNESCSKRKMKKTTWVFFLYKYRKF